MVKSCNCKIGLCMLWLVFGKLFGWMDGFVYFGLSL